MVSQDLSVLNLVIVKQGKVPRHHGFVHTIAKVPPKMLVRFDVIYLVQNLLTVRIVVAQSASFPSFAFGNSPPCNQDRTPWLKYVLT